MPQLTIREKESKKKALYAAIETLKAESLPNKNMVTQDNVCNLANKSDAAKKWSSFISVQTLKSKDSKGFGYEARIQIIKFKEDLKRLNNSDEKQLLDKVKIQDQRNDLLVIQVAKLLDNEIALKNEIKQLEALVKRKSDEIISLRKSLTQKK